MPEHEAILQLEAIRWRPPRSVKQVILASDFDEDAFWDFCRLQLETSLHLMGLGDFADDAFQETYTGFRKKLPDSGSFESVRDFANYFRRSGVYVAYRLAANTKNMVTSVEDLINFCTDGGNGAEERYDEPSIGNELWERLSQIFDRMNVDLKADSLRELSHHFRDRHDREPPWPSFLREPRATNDATQRTLRRRGMQQVYRWFDEGIFDRDLKPIVTFLFTGKISHD